MRRFKKNLCILLFTLIGVLSLTACGTRRAELDKPRGVELDEYEVLTWSAVENAVRYEVDVNGISYWTEEESLDLFERIVQPGEYRIRVCAYGGKGELPSDWSEAVSYTLNSPQGLIAFAEVDGGYTVAAVKPWKITGKLVIPEAVGGVPIVQIAEEGFRNCTDMTGVLIPNTVTSLGEKAFAGSALKRIRLSHAVEELDKMQFHNCASLTEVEFPYGMKYVGNAFRSCTALKMVRFSETVEDIRIMGFGECPNLTEVTVAEDNPIFRSEGNCVIRRADQMLVLGGNTNKIPDGVEEIGNNAFSSRIVLTSIIISESVRKINRSAFYNTGLTQIMIPAGIKEIAPASFGGCNNLTELSVAETNPVYESVGNCIIRRADRVLVAGCPVSVIPEGVTEIGEEAFVGFTNLREITLPSSIQTIGEAAFFHCIKLEKVKFPISLKTIQSYAFSYCFNLTEVYFPNGLQTIGREAFNNCQKIRSVVLPDSVETIDKNAFQYCTVYTSYLKDRSGWYVYEDPFISSARYYWSQWSATVYGCRLAYDGVYPYVEAYPDKAEDDGEFGVVDSIWWDIWGTHWANPRIPKRDGYTFAGWATEAGSTEVVYGVSIVRSEFPEDPFESVCSLSHEERLDIPYGTVLYAVWIPQS